MSESGSTNYIFSEVDSANGLILQQDTLSKDTINRIDSSKVKADTIAPKPTFAQIRYWRWLREKKLLIGDSRYIESEGEIELVSSLKVEPIGLGLPVREKNRIDTDWLTILFIIALILFATVRVFYAKYIGSLFHSLVNYSTTYRMFREKNYTFLHGAFRLDLMFYFVFSVFVFQVISFFNLTLVHKNLSFFGSIFGMVIGYFLLKKMTYYILGLIFEGVSETNEYLFSMDNLNRTLGIVLFPVVALINYYPAEYPVFMVVVGLVVVALFYVFLLQRGIFVLLKKQFSIFYLFLYLCTLEILPLLLIYKVVVL